jgi:hypothetical protein
MSVACAERTRRPFQRGFHEEITRPSIRRLSRGRTGGHSLARGERRGTTAALGGRSNLTLLLNSNVLKVNFTGKRATGIRAVVDGATKDIAAAKEIILTAGGVHSAKLFLLSGVGDAAALRPLGFDVVENLRGVGKNLQDHILVSGVVFKYKGKMPDRPADSDAVEAEIYLSSGQSAAGTDINLVLEQLPAATPESAARLARRPPMRSRSRRRWCSRPAAASCAWPAPARATLSSSTATSWEPTRI